MADYHHLRAENVKGSRRSGQHAPNKRNRSNRLKGCWQEVRLLRYEDIRKCQRRRRLRRWALALLVLIVVKVGLVTMGDRAWTAVQAHFWQQQCLSFEWPSERVAYLAAPQGVELPDYLLDLTGATRSTWTGSLGALPYPIELAQFQKLTAPSAVPWDSLPAPVFLHGLDDSHGRQRMVTVYVLANNPPGWWTLVALVREPVGWRATRNKPIVSTACWPMPKSLNDTLVVFAGQPDPSDRSRFKLRIALNGMEQMVSGALRDDRTIEFTSTNGLSPWSISRTGPIVIPRVVESRYDANDSVLLLTD